MTRCANERCNTDRHPRLACKYICVGGMPVNSQQMHHCGYDGCGFILAVGED